MPALGGVLELLAESCPSVRDRRSTRKPGRRAQLARRAPAQSARRRRSKLRHHHVRRRSSRPTAGNMLRSPITTRMRSSPSEKPQAGTFCAEEHADQVVVAAAAAEAAGQIGDANLEDRRRCSTTGRAPGSRSSARCGPALRAWHSARISRSSSSAGLAFVVEPRADCARRSARVVGRRPRASKSSASSASRRVAGEAARRQLRDDRRRGRSCRPCRARPAPCRAASRRHAGARRARAFSSWR